MFPEELKITKQDYMHKWPFCEEKEWYKIINIIVERTENVCHVRMQNLHFAHAPHNKNRKKH